MERLNNMLQKAKKHRGKIMAGAILAGALAFSPWVYVTSEDCLRGGEIKREISRLETTLSDRYKIEVNVWVEPPEGYDRPPPVRTSSLISHSPYMSLKTLEGLGKAMLYYPKELLQKHLRKIEIVREYLTSNEEIMKQGATPIANTRWWGGMSISAGRNDWLRYHRTVLGTIFEKESFHHELAHMLTQDIPKKEWKALHPDAVYDSSTWNSLSSTPPGFFNIYCTHSVGEDIASTVELLYSKDYGKRVGKDHILRKKSEYLKHWYLTISSGVIKEEYWSTVQKGEIPKF